MITTRQYAAGFMFILIAFLSFTVPLSAQTALAVKSGSNVKGIVLWSKETRGSTVVLNASLSFLTPTPIIFDTMGYLVVPDWSEGASLPQRDYLREATAERVDSQHSTATLNTIPAAKDIASVTICCGVVIPLNKKVVDPAWNRDRLGALFVFGLKGKPVFLGVTRLPRPEKIRVGGQDSEIWRFTLKDLVTMQTYIDGTVSHQRRLPEALRAQVKAQIANALSKDVSVPMLYRAVIVFDEVRKKNPTLTEEQLFEVASIVGNATKTNAKYFMLYKDGIPTEGTVLQNPGFDYRDTSGNVPD